MAWRRFRTASCVLLVALAAGLLGRLLLSIPLVASVLVSTLETYPPITPDQLRSAEAIVVIGGGVEWVRADYAARLQAESHLPILVSGGNPPGVGSEASNLRRVIEQDNKGSVRWFEDQSSSTIENAAFSTEILRADGIQRIALVTDSWHMRRAAFAFSRAGLTVIPAPVTPAVPLMSNPHSVVPSFEAAQVSMGVVREWLRILWGYFALT